MFQNHVISYEIINDVCVITYNKGIHIDADAGASIIAEKTRLQEKTNIRKFIGVLDSSVSIDKKIMGHFATKDALRDVDLIGVVYIHKNKIGRMSYSIGCVLLNGLVWLTFKKRNIRFFNNEKKALTWMNNLSD